MRSRSNWNLKVLVFKEKGDRSNRRKTSRSKGENQQQTQPLCGVDARIRTWATLVGGGCSHHCSILAPLARMISKLFTFFKKCGSKFMPISQTFLYLQEDKHQFFKAPPFFIKDAQNHRNRLSFLLNNGIQKHNQNVYKWVRATSSANV